MHDCASILGSNAKGTSCCHDISHSASLHQHSFIFLHLFHMSLYFIRSSPVGMHNVLTCCAGAVQY